MTNLEIAKKIITENIADATDIANSAKPHHSVIPIAAAIVPRLPLVARWE